VLLTLIRKEIREMLNKSTIIYMVVLAFIFGFIGNFISNTQEEMVTSIVEGTTVVAVENHDAGPYAATVIAALDKGADVVYAGPSREEAHAALVEKEGVALLTIPGDFSQKIESGVQATVSVLWLMQGTGITDALPGAVIQQLLDSAKREISSKLITEHSSLQPNIVLDPATADNTTEFRGKTVTGMTPDEITGVLSSRTMIIPIAIMMLIIMGATSVISSMGMEKENRTLETLLTLPIRRSDIIVSKIVGSAVAGLALGLIYMAGFLNYFNSFSASSVNLADLGLALGAGDYVLIGLSVFAALLAALCMAIILGTFASSYRQAQTLTFPIIGLAMLPMMVTMFMDFGSMSPFLRFIIFIIPFSHPMMAMKALMLDNYTLVIGGILYSLTFTAIMVMLTVRIFTTDRVVIGTMPRKFKLFKFGR
jgi:ABC-2 type transport system permease protein